MVRSEEGLRVDELTAAFQSEDVLRERIPRGREGLITSSVNMDGQIENTLTISEAPCFGADLPVEVMRDVYLDALISAVIVARDEDGETYDKLTIYAG